MTAGGRPQGARSRSPGLRSRNGSSTPTDGLTISCRRWARTTLAEITIRLYKTEKTRCDGPMLLLHHWVMGAQAENFFTPWERKVDDWSSAMAAINDVQELSGNRDLVWRGVSNFSYELHSSLYRRLITQSGAAPPKEKKLQAYETRLLERARRRWRFDNLRALEILAHIQHYGGPTRMIDVSWNPLVALWFAVEQKYNKDGSAADDVDGRLLVFDATDRLIDLDDQWGGYVIPWTDAKAAKDWQTGLPRVWRPPSYNDRIPAQNSGFLLGGVPMVTKGQNTRYRKGPGDGSTMGTWSIDEVRQATSVTVYMVSADRKPHEAASQRTFTLRVKAHAKAQIRAKLEDAYGLYAASVYPDLFGLAQHGHMGMTA